MGWGEIAAKVAGLGAPLLGNALLPGVGGLVASAGVKLLAEVLGVDEVAVANDPDAVMQALDADPEIALKLREVESRERVRLAEIAAERRTAELAAERDHLREVNETMRAEYQAAIAGAGVWRTGWRPAFGWAMAASFAWTMGCIGYVIGFDPGNAAAAVQSAAGMSSVWWVGLSVLGIVAAKRSDDKALAAGREPTPGLLGALAQRLTGGAG